MYRLVISSIILLFCLSCGGSLSEEQRKNFQKEKGHREIKRVKEEEIYKKALEIGESVIEKAKKDGTQKAEETCNCTIKYVTHKSDDLTSKEESLWLAYTSDSGSDSHEANAQKEGSDFMIVSKLELQDSTVTDSVKGVWFVRITKKEIVLAL